jgi:catechol 2,3-dioxygenase-like lactoylglutathione lyase family enzyme
MRVVRANVILYCERWAETSAYYRSLLGDDAVTFENEWFVELAVGDGSFVSIADAARATVAPAGGAGITLSWQVEDVRRTRDELIANGFEPSEVGHRFGSPVVDLFDPEGHRIELWSRVS